MQQTVGAREANQRFSTLLSETAEGAEIVITKHGRPVAKLIPFSGEEGASAKPEAARASDSAFDQIRSVLEQGVPFGAKD